MLSLCLLFASSVLLVTFVTPSEQPAPPEPPARPARAAALGTRSARLVGLSILGVIGLASLLGACNPSSNRGQLEDFCRTSADCSGELQCEQLQAMGYWGGLDSGGEEAKVCTVECATDRDCPVRKERTCGVLRGTCEEGWCRELTICEG